ncbi:MAG: biotin/lipoyl-binding protein, partial [Acetobacter sp.]|nr:biotin/lipoyl-binding protein [Acetobacter sp.]
MVCAVQVQAVRAQQVQHMPTVEISAAALKREHIQMAVAKKSTTVSKHIDGLAYVEDDLRRVANIRPIGTGRVTSIEVVKGQSVRKGQVLIKYNNFFMRDEKDRLTVVKAMLQEARAQQMSAEQIYQRGKKLSGGALSVSEVERRRIALQAANAVVQQREAEL